MHLTRLKKKWNNKEEINKGPTTDNGDSNWIFFQVGYPVATSHFAATPQSDVVRIYAPDFQCHGDAFVLTENACFRAFITLRSQFHLHHCSQRTLTEIVSKITPNLGLVL